MPKYDIKALADEYEKKVSQMGVQPSQPPPPEVSKTESAIRGGAQGLSFGFADEATARLESILKNKPYEEALQETRSAYKQAQEANPITYTGSEIAGGVLPALIPTGVTQATGAASLGRLALIGAGTGALSGLGYSEGKDIGEVARDVGIGGALGGALPVIGRGVQSAIQGIKPAIDVSIKSGLSTMTGKTLPYLEKVESQPERIKKIEKIFTGTGKEETQKLANDITDLVSKNPFGRKAELLSNRSYKILEKESDNISLSKENVLNNLKNIANDLNTSSDVDELTLRALTKKISKIDQRYPDVLNGMQSKKLIKEIDKDIKALSPKLGEQRQLPIDAENRLNLYKTIRSEIDVPLKTQSPNYAESMKPVADATNVSEYLQRLTVSQYGGKQASAKKAEEFINQKLRQNALTPLEAESRTLKLMQKELENPRYNNYTGIEKLRDVNQTISDLKLLQEIQATGAIGSSVTNRMMGSGAAIGSALGGTPGTIAGTLGGALLAPRMERGGGKIAESILRKTKNIRTQSEIPQPTQRGFAAQQGIQRGLLDQFLSENKSEVERRQKSEANFNDIKNRAATK